MAKMSGMAANNICAGLLALRIEATPIAESTIPAPKLAVAEKHIIRKFKNDKEYLYSAM